MEAYIEISLNPNKSHKHIALPNNFDQLKAEFKKAYDLTQKQLSNLKIIKEIFIKLNAKLMMI